MTIDISALTDDEVRALEARLRALPPPKPFVSDWKPFDPLAKICAVDPRNPPPWVRAMLTPAQRTLLELNDAMRVMREGQTQPNPTQLSAERRTKP